MNDVFLSLGSNEGDRTGWLKKAIEMLAEDCGSIVARSSVYETAAWGPIPQADFLNMVVQVRTTLAPLDLLSACQAIETALGRQRDVKWGPRTLDVDILLYNNDVIDLPGLTVPHPFLHQRRFTLIPLAEIAADYMHPKLHTSIAGLLSNCPDTLEVHKYTTDF